MGIMDFLDGLKDKADEEIKEAAREITDVADLGDVRVLKQILALKKDLSGEVSDGFLELLLDVMAMAFNKHPLLDKLFPNLENLRKDVLGFSGSYLFKSMSDKDFCAGAIFDDGKVSVQDTVAEADRTLEKWNIILNFRTPTAFRNFLFSKDQDILNLVLTDDVEVTGNLNCMFKFGFLAKDLLHQTGLDKVLKAV